MSLLWIYIVNCLDFLYSSSFWNWGLCSVLFLLFTVFGWLYKQTNQIHIGYNVGKKQLHRLYLSLIWITHFFVCKVHIIVEWYIFTTVTNPVASSTFTALSSRLLSPFPELVFIPGGNCIHQTVTPRLPLPQDPGNFCSTSCLSEFACSSASSKWNHTAFGLPCLTYLFRSAWCLQGSPMLWGASEFYSF